MVVCIFVCTRYWKKLTIDFRETAHIGKCSYRLEAINFWAKRQNFWSKIRPGRHNYYVTHEGQGNALQGQSALNLPVAKIKDLVVCWNYCFRKLFGYKRFESLKEVQYFGVNYRLIWFMSYSNGSFWVLQISFATDFPVCNPQSHTVCELKIKFGDTDSVGRMKQLVHVYIDRLFE